MDIPVYKEVRARNCNKLPCFYLSQIVAYAARVCAHVTLAYAGERANVKAAAGAFSGDADHNVILEAEPEGCSGSFDAALRGIAGDDFPTHGARGGQSAIKGLGRRRIEVQRTYIGISLLL